MNKVGLCEPFNVEKQWMVRVLPGLWEICCLLWRLCGCLVIAWAKTMLFSGDFGGFLLREAAPTGVGRMWLISVFHCLLLSTRSTARCLEWSLAWWAAPLGYTLHLSPPGGRTCRQLTAVIPAHLCIRHATLPRVTCTRPLSLAGTPSMNTRSISPASPTSTGKPRQAGRNSPCTLLTLMNANILNTFNQVH